MSHAMLQKIAGVALGLTAAAPAVGRQHAALPVADELRTRAVESVSKGLGFLTASQRPDGGWELRGQSDPAITALAARCFIQSAQYGPDHPIVRRAIDFVLRFQQDDGGIYIPDAGLHNYYTSVCLATLAATDDERLAPVIEAAQKKLKDLQWDETEDIDRTNTWYGGAGYGQHKRPDLSNTQMMIEALRESGLPPDDPAFKKAMQFVSRCQMSSDTNDQPFARGVTDGGFVYTPVGGGESKAGQIMIENQPRLRSYGSMTYAGFKSMLYADVERDDPRVIAALDWIRKHYTLDSNPNMPDRQSHEGLYYFYHVFAKALAAWGEPTLVDADGAVHDWRAELCDKLISLQYRDGSWVNQADRWYEGNPALVTSYAILAMQVALAPERDSHR